MKWRGQYDSNLRSQVSLMHLVHPSFKNGRKVILRSSVNAAQGAGTPFHNGKIFLPRL
jgi:hypothetical protein